MHIFAALIVGILAGLSTTAPLAQAIDPCPLGILSCPGGEADTYLFGIAVRGAKYAFGGILFAMIIFYGAKLISQADNDSTVTEIYNAYAQAAIGTIIAGAAFMFADTFAVPGQLINQDPTIDVFFGVIIAFKSLLYAALVFNLFYQGYRLVTSQDESQIEKAKKQFIYGMVGAAIVLLADSIVFAFTDRQIFIISEEAIGLANFLGAVFGAFAVIALFIAGLYLVLAVSEQNKDKAKKIILVTLVAIAVVIASLALIRIVVRAPFT